MIVSRARAPRIPLRRCLGCGRSRPRRELVRFVASGKEVMPRSSGGGRGAYLCMEKGCFEAALKKKDLFSRVFRKNVEVVDLEEFWQWAQSIMNSGQR